jgi:hypothetical protein
MKIKLKCGCKGSLNKRKKVFTVSHICGKHLKAIIERVHKEMWCGWHDTTPTRKPFGKSLLTPAVLKQYREFMAPYETLTVSPNTLFWLRWLEKQRGKTLRFSYKGIPIVTSKPKGTK